MVYKKVLLGHVAQKDVQGLNIQEKAELTEALDLMESRGQLGEILHHSMNVWKHKTNSLRFFYKNLPENLLIIKVLKRVDSLQDQR